MPKDYSPFTPGVPVPVEFFIGRRAEIDRLREKIGSATTGRLQVAFLSGERGIGKSSLASFVRFLVERDYQVLGLHTFLGGVKSLTELVRKIFDRLLKDSAERAWHEKVTDFLGNHVRQVGLFGVSIEFDPRPRDLELMVDQFAPALRKLCERLKDEKKAIFLVLDDINGLAESVHFANWLKSLVDEIATSQQPLPLCVLLVGLDERRQVLIASQPSLARVFDLIEIRAWADEETRTFYENAFSKVGVSVDEDALGELVSYAGGLPVLAHEIGDAVFNVDRDDHIDEADAFNGLLAAADIVGRKHLEPQIVQAIRSAHYRTILRKIAGETLYPSFQRAEIRERLNEEEAKVFDNFLRRMTDLGVIVREPERGRGVYRFANLLYDLYFSMEARRAAQGRKR